LHHLGSRSIWIDEGASLSIASQRGSAFFRALGRDGGNQAAYYVVLRATIAIFGSGERVLRAPALIASVATVPLVFGLANNARGRRCGLYAAAVIAICEPLVYWGQMARAETLSAAFAAGSGWAFLSVVRRGGRIATTLWILCSVLMCYSLLLAVLIVAGQLITLLALGSRCANRRRVWSGAGIVVLLLGPLIVLASNRGTGQLFWLSKPSTRAVEAAFRLLVGSDGPAIGRWPGMALEVTVVVLLLAALVMTVVAVTRRRWNEADPLLLALTWVVVAPLGAFVFSVLIHPVFLDRYFVPCLPGVALVLALVLDRIRPAVLGALLLLGVVVLRGTQIAPSYRMVRDNWRGATAYVLSHRNAGDCTAFYANDGWIDFNYYLGRSAPNGETVPPLRPVLPLAAFGGPEPLLDETYLPLRESDFSGCVRLWFLVSHTGQTGPANVERRAIVTGLAESQRRLRAHFARSVLTRFTHVDVVLYSDPHRRPT
jgi:uncharacterized membrane protein